MSVAKDKVRINGADVASVSEPAKHIAVAFSSDGCTKVYVDGQLRQ